MTPDDYTNEELMLKVSDGHTLYVHDWGNSDAQTPILFLHGGPGGSSKDRYKQQFDPKHQRVIFFDQRGGGRSLPSGSLEHNDTAHQIADITAILDHFTIQQAVLTGGSWGCALALFFGIAHPERISAMVLDGIWAGSQRESDWLDRGGYRVFFPDIWDRYLAQTPAEYHTDPTAYHFDRILSDDEQAIKESGYTYETLEGAAVSLDDRFTPDNFADFDPSGIRVEVHYLANNSFVPDRYVFDNASKLTMPIYMVQGRYDMVCPPETAYELSQLLPNAELIWTISGHKAERETWNIKRTILRQLTA